MTNDRRPAEVFPIGATVDEELAEYGWTRAQLAARIGYSAEALNAVLDGHHRLPVRMAEAFERHMGGSAVFWLNLDRYYRTYRTVAP